MHHVMMETLYMMLKLFFQNYKNLDFEIIREYLNGEIYYKARAILLKPYVCKDFKL